MNRSAGTIFLVVILTGVPARAQSLAFDATTVGVSGSGARAELFMPVAAGSSAGVVVLHGCDGMGPHYRDWARQIAEWGYAALLVDSFRPRGFTEVCNRGMLVPPEVQARDAFDAAAYLRKRLQAPSALIGVIGFSHGGWAVLKAVLAGVVRGADEPPFAAAVAFYPGCDPPGSALETDTLILIGDADEWTPVARCARWRDMAQPNGHVLQMKVYPGALHSFDALLPPHAFAGHYVGRNPAAAADALAETRAFLASHLGSRSYP
jgi:dienelactone hydrolase